jgi:hypothetical protein
MALTKNSWRVLATLGLDLIKEGISLPYVNPLGIVSSYFG